MPAADLPEASILLRTATLTSNPFCKVMNSNYERPEVDLSIPGDAQRSLKGGSTGGMKKTPTIHVREFRDISSSGVINIQY